MFHRIGSAHASLNGVLKDFWELMARDEKVQLKVGNDIRLTTDQIRAISANVKAMRGTSAFDAGLPNLLEYERHSGVLRWIFPDARVLWRLQCSGREIETHS